MFSIQPHPNPNMRVFHTRIEMCESYQMGTRGDEGGLGEFGKLFLQIRGVVSVELVTYMVIIGKADLFNWNEIEPEVIKILSHLVTSENQLRNVAK